MEVGRPLRAEYWISNTENSGFVGLEKSKEKLLMVQAIIWWCIQHVLYFIVVSVVASQADMWCSLPSVNCGYANFMYVWSIVHSITVKTQIYATGCATSVCWS